MSVKYLIESLMLEGDNENTLTLLAQAQQAYRKDVTLSKLKYDIYIPFSQKFF